VRRRHRHAGPCQAERGLDESCPRQAAGGAPERVQTSRHARDGARRRADCVVDHLLAEGDGQVRHRGAGARRNGHEAVEVAHHAGLGVERDRVPAAEQSGHQRLRDARREGGRYRRVRVLTRRPRAPQSRRQPSPDGPLQRLLEASLLPYGRPQPRPRASSSRRAGIAETTIQEVLLTLTKEAKL